MKSLAVSVRTVQSICSTYKVFSGEQREERQRLQRAFSAVHTSATWKTLLPFATCLLRCIVCAFHFCLFSESLVIRAMAHSGICNTWTSVLLIQELIYFSRPNCKILSILLSWQVSIDWCQANRQFLCLCPYWKTAALVHRYILLFNDNEIIWMAAVNSVETANADKAIPNNPNAPSNQQQAALLAATLAAANGNLASLLNTSAGISTILPSNLDPNNNSAFNAVSFSKCFSSMNYKKYYVFGCLFTHLKTLRLDMRSIWFPICTRHIFVLYFAFWC